MNGDLCMTIKVSVDALDFNNFNAQVRELAECIDEKPEDNSDFLKGMPESLKEYDDLMAMFYRCKYHLLTRNFLDIVNDLDRDYKKGDLWILASDPDMVEEIEDAVRQELG